MGSRISTRCRTLIACTVWTPRTFDTRVFRARWHGKKLVGAFAVLVALSSSVVAPTAAVADTGCPTAAAPTDTSIATPANLQWLKETPSQWGNSFTQTAHIDMGGCTWTSVIGTGASPFTGGYDGGGFTISGLNVDMGSSDFAGLFGHVNASGKEIARLGFTGTVRGGSYVGGLVGWLQNGAVKLSFATGNVTAAVGKAAGTRIYAGGLVGDSAGIIEWSYATGNVTATGGERVGGLAGRATGGSISNSFSRGSVSAATGVGGLASFSDGTSVQFSYSTGSVTATDGGGLAGGLTAFAPAGGSVANSYWDTQTSGTASSGGGVGKTTAQMQDIATYSGWSIASVFNPDVTTWGICPGFNGGYPFLQAIYTADPCVGGARSITPSVSSVSATVDTAITSVTISATGFIRKVSYSISPNSLPTGLSFNTATGAISGTPTVTSASSTYTITATDGISSANTSVSIAVAAAPSPPPSPSNPGSGTNSDPSPTPTPTPAPVSPSSPNLDAIRHEQNANVPSRGLPLGETVLLVNGVATAVTVKPEPAANPTRLAISGPGFSLQLNGLSNTNSPIPLTDRGALVLDKNATVLSSGSGFMAGTSVYVWLFSEPRLLGTLSVGAEGIFSGSLPLPGNIRAGIHTLQVNGVTAGGEVRSISQGVELTTSSDTRRVRRASATVFFAADSSVLSESMRRRLDSLVAGRKKAVTRVVATGFVRGSGTRANVRALSLARAQSVVNYLKSQGVAGVAVARSKGVAKEMGDAGRKAVATIDYRK